jgi:hypothetical protein
MVDLSILLLKIYKHKPVMHTVSAFETSNFLKQKHSACPYDLQTVHPKETASFFL